MPQSDLSWLKGTANDLNNLLQVIADSAQVIEPFCQSNEEARRYHQFLSTSLNRAIQTTTEMAARLGGEVDSSMAPDKPAPLREKLPTPAHIANPEGPLELVMLVDDEPIILQIVTAFLTNAGYRVTIAPDPLRAITVFKELKDSIDLVVLDFTLPIMDGAELFDELRGIKSDVTVMLSSGFTEHSKLSGMLAKGLRGFLPKPYTEARLLEQIRSTLDAVRADRTGERRVL